jgi:hypothetical protein
MDVVGWSRQLLFTTVLISTTSARGSGTGTGFLYEVQTSPEQKELFLVTNKHVVEGADVVSLRFIASVDDAMSAPKWGEAYSFNIREPEHVFYGHDDGQIDVAVALCTPWLDQLYKANMPVFVRAIESYLAMNASTQESLDALEEVVFVGYPNGLFDQANYLPIARRGMTASPPNMDFNGQPVFLIDASVFPGSSGSPVLILQTGSYAGRSGSINLGERIVFLGVVAAVYQRRVPVLKASTHDARFVHDALDIGVVYNARAVDETVDKVLALGGVSRYVPDPQA